MDENTKCLQPGANHLLQEVQIRLWHKTSKKKSASSFKNSFEQMIWHTLSHSDEKRKVRRRETAHGKKKYSTLTKSVT